MLSSKGNLVMILGFIELIIFIVLDKVMNKLTDEISLTGYLVGCAILVIGLIMNKKRRY